MERGAGEWGMDIDVPSQTLQCPCGQTGPVLKLSCSMQSA